MNTFWCAGTNKTECPQGPEHSVVIIMHDFCEFVIAFINDVNKVSTYSHFQCLLFNTLSLYEIKNS